VSTRELKKTTLAFIIHVEKEEFPKQKVPV